MRPRPSSVEVSALWISHRCTFAVAPYNESNMPSDSQQDSDPLRNDSEDFRTVRKNSEEFGNVPQPSEAVRTVPNDAEARESHTLTVREVARMFEASGVARTERSVVNWCRKDAAGISRLDCRYDQNERKYFITPESTERAIQEELAKIGAAEKLGDRAGGDRGDVSTSAQAGAAEFKRKIQDLEISNRAKDYFIEQLQNDRTLLLKEQRGLSNQLSQASRTLGQLEAKLQLLGPGGGSGSLLTDESEPERPT